MGHTSRSKSSIKIPVGYSSVSLDELKDEIIGLPGSSERKAYETDLKEGMVGDVIRQMRKLRNFTQEELGNKIGVGKAQISKMEKNYNNVTVANFLRVLDALDVKVILSVEKE